MPRARFASRGVKSKTATARAERTGITPRVEIPDENAAVLEVAGRRVSLTNLRKVFWPELGLTKRDLLQYYADVAPVLLPHVRQRAMVMKRYPNGVAGNFFFMKRAPAPRPDWIQLCAIEHDSGNVIHFPVVQDLPSLLWLVNLGCIDLNQWYAPCDDVNRPDYLHFDLDPVPDATFEQVLETAAHVHAALDRLKIPNYAKPQARAAYTSMCRSFAGRRRSSVDFRQSLCPGSGGRTPATHHGRIPQSEAAASCAGRLQPECLGTHAGLGLLGPADAAGGRLDARDLAGD